MSAARKPPFKQFKSFNAFKSLKTGKVHPPYTPHLCDKKGFEKLTAEARREQRGIFARPGPNVSSPKR
jgi:hypothetical protein